MKFTSGTPRCWCVLLILLWIQHASAAHPFGTLIQDPSFVRGGGSAVTAKAVVTPIDQSANNISSSNSISETVSETQVTLPSWKADLPPSLQQKGPKTLQRILLGSVEIYLIGTAHVSLNSSADVHDLLHAVHPDAILVELCDARIPLLEKKEEMKTSEASTRLTESNATTNATTAASTVELSKPPFWERVAMMQQEQGGSRLQAMSTVLLTNVQEEYASELGVELGGEFQCAFQYWKNRTRETRRLEPSLGADPLLSLPLQRCHLILGDRPLQLTLIRAWESLWWWPKLKVLAGLLWSSWRQPSKEEIREWLEEIMQEESDVLTKSFDELKQHFPSLHQTIIAERDAWLAAKIVQSCRGLAAAYYARQRGSSVRCGNPRLVAIVGAGHVPGICRWLTNNHTNDDASQKSQSPPSPEEMLKDLVVTKKWANDPSVQNECIPMWIHEVTELQDNSDYDDARARMDHHS